MAALKIEDGSPVYNVIQMGAKTQFGGVNEGFFRSWKKSTKSIILCRRKGKKEMHGPCTSCQCSSAWFSNRKGRRCGEGCSSRWYGPIQESSLSCGRRIWLENLHFDSRAIHTGNKIRSYAKGIVVASNLITSKTLKKYQTDSKHGKTL